MSLECVNEQRPPTYTHINMSRVSTAPRVLLAPPPPLYYLLPYHSFHTAIVHCAYSDPHHVKHAECTLWIFFLL